MLHRLNQNRGAVSQDLGHSLHDLGRVVARANDRVPAKFSRMLQHEIEGLGGSFLTKICQERDIASDEGLQACADGAEDGTRSHNNSAYYAKGLYDAKTV